MSDIIVQLTDIHLFEDAKKVHKGRAPFEQLSAIIDHVEETFVDKKVLLTGDLVSDVTPKTYELLAQALKKLKAPIYVLPGNHDDYQMMKKYLRGENIFFDTEIMMNDWLVILLDSSLPGKNLGAGRLADSELQRLKRLLNLYPDKPVIIAIHHPPLPIGAKWFQRICLENRAKLMKLVEMHDNVRAILFGHAHMQYAQFLNHHVLIGAPSTWIQYDHRIHHRATPSHLPGGYNWYRLGPDYQLEFGTYYL